SFVAGTASAFPSTDFTVLSITFSTLQVGSTNLTFRRPPTGSPVTEATRNAASVLASVTNGVVNVSAVGCTLPTATISAPGATITCDGQPFNLTLASATGQ